MIRHIVFWKFRPDADPEPFLQALSALPEQIDWIRGMHVARSAAPNAAWDAALEVDFDTLETWRAIATTRATRRSPPCASPSAPTASASISRCERVVGLHPALR